MPTIHHMLFDVVDIDSASCFQESQNVRNASVQA